MKVIVCRWLSHAATYRNQQEHLLVVLDHAGELLFGVLADGLIPQMHEVSS